MDGNYQEYINRVVQMTMPANYKQQLANIQPSPKFNNGVAVEFPGYSIITPPWKDDEFNDEFYQHLKEVQKQLKDSLPEGLFLIVPPESFHITLADLIWDKDYIAATKENEKFDELLIAEIGKIFEESQKLPPPESLELELLGISIFPRAIAVCLAPTEASYNYIIEIRKMIYQNEQIIKLGIEQQYEFAAHITLGYFGKSSKEFNVEEVEQKIVKINDELAEKKLPPFRLKQWELRKFTDMTNYIREEDWARIRL